MPGEGREGPLQIVCRQYRHVFGDGTGAVLFTVIEIRLGRNARNGG